MKKIEHNLQVAIVKLLRMNNFLVFAVPNGGSRYTLEAKTLKAEGCLAGVSDLIIVLKGQTIFVELKRPDGGRQSEKQKIFQEEIEKRGQVYLIWKTIEDAVVFINKFRNLK